MLCNHFCKRIYAWCQSSSTEQKSWLPACNNPFNTAMMPCWQKCMTWVIFFATYNFFQYAANWEVTGSFALKLEKVQNIGKSQLREFSDNCPTWSISIGNYFILTSCTETRCQIMKFFTFIIRLIVTISIKSTTTSFNV